MNPKKQENPWALVLNSTPGELWLLVSSRTIPEVEFVVIPLLAMRGPIHVIVAGGGYDSDNIMRRVRMLTTDTGRVIKNIQQRRGPTSYQVRALLRKTPSDGKPVIVMNFLHQFLIEEDELWKQRWLMEDSILELKRLSQQAPVIITARPPVPQQQGHSSLYETLLDITSNILIFDKHHEINQLSMF